MKKALVMLATGLLTISSANSATNLNELGKDVNIMSGILKTALKQQNDRKGIRFRDLDVSYLKNQGVVFYVHTSNSNWNINFDLSGMLSSLSHIPRAPVAPVDGKGDHVVIDIDTDKYQDEIADAMEDAQDAMREAQDKMRDLRDQQRELGWQQREYERKRQDLKFEQLHADKEDNKKLDEKLKNLDARQKELEAKRKDIEKYAAKLEKQQQKQREATEKARQQYTKAFLSGFEDTVGNVLCKYGAGMKSMDKNEHVSFVLDDFVKLANHHKQDRVYVISNRDIHDCVVGKINKDTLLKRMQAYQF